ncbi:VOC family protein [Actinospica sp.]|jgi:catechol 2,3-dioxygenase-like lactoylglutathione lyase family enzyme|uniref:VOC family protein n=1 Tax=Actinospica sp. TaxID=1872142 RepID=UPI002BC74BD8|nr:VOC family protein [Actinospica sp.]HWG23488.1 VOC family protein [Actinospica sp.]
MSLRIRHITFDCADPYLLARFWAELLGYREDPRDPNRPGAAAALILDPRGTAGLLFIRVPEPKAVKNRVHFDVWPDAADGAQPTRDQALVRMLELGAGLVEDRREPDGTGWVVLADPEGNEFCLERSRTERSASLESAADEHLRTELDHAYDSQLRLLGHARRRLAEITAQRRRIDRELSVLAAQTPGHSGLEALRAKARERARAEQRTQALVHELQAEVSSFRAEIERHRTDPEVGQTQNSLDQLNALLDTLPGVGGD